MAQVELKHLVKRFGDLLAVDHVDLTVRDQELLVLVGPSGSGKTTTLRMIAGLEEATEGEVWIGDRLVNRLAPKDRDVAMVFQGDALYPHMNVYQNMAFGLRMRRTARSEIERHVQEAARLLGIEDLLKRKPGQLSGGQRQRVALGRAIVRSPAVFLFDEPLSNLDAKLRGTMRVEVVKLQKRLATTTIYVTHDQVEAMMMGDRIAVMNRGRVGQVGEPMHVYDAPANRFVAEFIGSPPMNFFPGRLIIDSSAGIRIQVGPRRLSIPSDRIAESHVESERPVVLGIRPEHIRLPMDEVPSDAVGVPAEVILVQPLGAETIVDLASDIGEFVARVNSRATCRRGDRLSAHVDLTHAHLFDAESGNSLRPASSLS